jgi:hypothetical protein
MELAMACRCNEGTASVQKQGVLNIVIDKEIIVTNACYIGLGSIVLLPNACDGRPLISKGGGFRQII